MACGRSGSKARRVRADRRTGGAVAAGGHRAPRRIALGIARGVAAGAIGQDRGRRHQCREKSYLRTRARAEKGERGLSTLANRGDESGDRRERRQWLVAMRRVAAIEELHPVDTAANLTLDGIELRQCSIFIVLTLHS